MFFRLFEILFYRTALLASKWLKKNSTRYFHRVATELGSFPLENEPPSIDRIETTLYKANNEKGLERLTGSGSPGDSMSAISLRRALPRWAEEITPFLANQLSPHTRIAYETDLKHFFRFLEGRISDAAMREFSLRVEHIVLYRRYLESGGTVGGGGTLAQSTINRKLAVVKSFLQWLKRNELIRDNPAELVKGYPQTQESSLKGFSDEEVRKILGALRTHSRAGALHAAILNILFYMGLRKSELLSLRMGDITSERGVRVLKVRGKGHRVRILPLTEKVDASLKHYFRICRRDDKEIEAPVFMPTKNPRFHTLEKPMHPNAVTYIVQHYAKKAGILKRISPHSCRATCISNALDRKATHRSVQHLAGWSTPLMIQRYDKRREDLKNSAAYLVNYE
jgi:integrase/recombinase XerD